MRVLTAAISLSSIALILFPSAALSADDTEAPGPPRTGTSVVAGNNGDHTLEIIARKTQPGSDGTERDGNGNPQDGSGGGTQQAAHENVPPQPGPMDICLDKKDDLRICFEAIEEAEEEPDDDPGIRPITITDLASFAPKPVTLTGEPENVGVAGRPTNFIAPAKVHEQKGELFNHPISVRFTPAQFTFHYGDGDTRTADNGGTTWESENLPQFTPTDTSHAYAERGQYTAHATVDYTAEINLGTGWHPINGTLTVTTPDQGIRIYEAHTALVAHTCTEDPTGPGC